MCPQATAGGQQKQPVAPSEAAFSGRERIRRAGPVPGERSRGGAYRDAGSTESFGDVALAPEVVYGTERQRAPKPLLQMLMQGPIPSLPG